MNPLWQLRHAEQSVWFDFLRRSLLVGDGLERLMRDDAVSGVTSNPTIFGKAIGGSTDYDHAIEELAKAGATSALEIFYDLALTDVRMAADALGALHEQSGGVDGFVSFELEAGLAHNSAATISAAGELFQRIGKPNVMIKVPGTPEGIVAVEELTAAGVNVNITLLFSVETYEQVALAYLAGLERRLAAGQPLDRVASVASFFVSRVDTAVDAQLPEGSPLRGRAAVANAKEAYQRFRRLFAGDRWQRLAAAGAHVQRPLWASTGTKNPAYSDVVYVEELVGPDTVSTMPEATLDAFRDHGRVRPTAILEELEEAEAVLLLLPAHGVDLVGVTAKLVQDGIQAFDDDFQKLLAIIETKREAVAERRRGPWAALGSLENSVANRLEEAEKNDVVGRIWRKDHTLWKPEPTEITDRLGWLTLPEMMPDHLGAVRAFADQAVSDGFTKAVLLGMGGSSLAPAVFREALGVAPGFLDLVVLDTTHPEAIAALDRSLDLDHTLFVAASKSGGTVETLSHLSYFYEKIGRQGDQFCAITDPGTPLAALADTYGFRSVFLNPPDIGGRYSALSLFGLVPAALIGADVDALLDHAQEMACACNRYVPGRDNPGLWLGTILGEAARVGRDKLTFVLPSRWAALGPWIEQLLAESTGKEGTGIVPVVDEDLGPPEVYGDDRLFVTLTPEVDLDLESLERASHPVVSLVDHGAQTLGSELFRWELATAIAGYVLGVNPFDQPNVAEAKEATRQILETGGVDDPGFDDVAAVLATIRPGDYVAIQAYLAPAKETDQRLQRIRLALRDRCRVATTLGYGPRFLHSTGQLHKGGADTGVFIQVVDPEREGDLPIPDRSYTFGTLIDAQALADRRSLLGRGRRVARTTVQHLEEVI